MLRGLSYYLPVSRSDAKVHDQFDVTLEDADLLGEVELTTNLIIAASEADHALPQAVIDRLLGVDESGGTTPQPRLLEAIPPQNRHSA
jgi:hypothetical protein